MEHFCFWQEQPANVVSIQKLKCSRDGHNSVHHSCKKSTDPRTTDARKYCKMPNLTILKKVILDLISLFGTGKNSSHVFHNCLNIVQDWAAVCSRLVINTKI